MIFDLLNALVSPTLEINGMSRVSDLHMKVGEPVRLRLDGDLEVMKGSDRLTEEALRELILPLLNEENQAKIKERKREDIDASYHWEAEKTNFRLNVFYDRDGLACVIRMLPRRIPQIKDIGFLDASVWKDLVELKQGLVLLTGVTSSGKSTTIASIIDHLNQTRKLRIITLEDPVEYVFESQQCLISQREIGSHVASFADGLRSALRENPDVIYVGEIRDAETAYLALTAAETGHLVLSTLHTRDAKGAYSRLLDMFPADRVNEVASKLSFSVAYIISQKLLPIRSKQGRVPVFEVLKNTPSIANLVRTGKLHQVYGTVETNRNEGMNTLEHHLVQLVNEGVISQEVAEANANDRHLLRLNR